jgi:hypothetical protein
VGGDATRLHIGPDRQSAITGQKAVEEGKSYADAEKEIKLPKYEKWGTYEPFLQMNIERYYDFHNRGI